jgi:hypothetical protein
VLADGQAGIQIKSEKEIHEEANKCWNLRNQPPITTWLAQSLGKHDLHRLHAIGNMVLPKCACLAMHLLLHAHRQETAGILNFNPSVMQLEFKKLLNKKLNLDWIGF